MTLGLVRLLGLFKAGLLAKFVVALFVLSMLPFTLFVDAMIVFVKRWRFYRATRARMATCPSGRHRIDLQAAWRCTCGMVWVGSGWEPCPSCGALSMVRCACGRTLINPLSKRPR